MKVIPQYKVISPNNYARITGLFKNYKLYLGFAEECVNFAIRAPDEDLLRLLQ